MWCQLASAAALLGNLLLSRKSWEQALCCNGHYWPAIEGLCTVLFALEDFYGKLHPRKHLKLSLSIQHHFFLCCLACLHAISQGLKLEPNYPRGDSYCISSLRHAYIIYDCYAMKFSSLFTANMPNPWETILLLAKAKAHISVQHKAELRT